MLEARFSLFARIAFPITAEKVEAALRSAAVTPLN